MLDALEQSNKFNFIIMERTKIIHVPALVVFAGLTINQGFGGFYTFGDFYQKAQAHGLEVLRVEPKMDFDLLKEDHNNRYAVIFEKKFTHRIITKITRNKKVVWFHYPCISSKEIGYLSEVLKENSTIEVLTLPNSNIDAEGAKMLLEALKEN